MKILRFFSLPLYIGLAMFGLLQSALAGSATWQANPGSNNWNTAANWTPATIPNGGSDTATFSVSNTTVISLTASILVDGIVFPPGASGFTITPAPGVNLTLEGAGVANNSGAMQNFVTAGDTNFNSGKIVFTNAASAGGNSVFASRGGVRLGGPGGVMQFLGNATAASSTYEVNGGEVRGAQGGLVEFYDNSTADESQFYCRAGAIDTAAGLVKFSDDASGGEASFVLEGATFSRSNGGSVVYESRSGAGESSYTVAGGAVSGAAGGYLQFIEGTSAENATITLESGAVANSQGAFMTLSGAVAFGAASAGDASIMINGGVGLGAEARFSGDATGGTARFTISGNGRLDLSGELDHLTIGSLDGSGGVVLLGARNLAVGSSNLSTTFAGTLQDGGFSGGTGGSLTKIGTGTLTLNGASTYTGGTNVNAGSLVVTNTTGSATGAGNVFMNTGGRLGGGGTIAGSVTIGRASFLSPANLTNRQATLKIEGSLSLEFGSVYNYTFKAKRNRARTDGVVANGVTIDDASFFVEAKSRLPLTQGLTLTLINNTSANPINGEFKNAPEGRITFIDGTNFRTTYHGGDGNDLTLTVVP